MFPGAECRRRLCPHLVRPAGDRLGVTRQVEDCQRLAERRGWPVREVYIDDDRSA